LHGRPHPARERGFTLVELMMVMMLIAIVTAMSAARFADREPFAVQGAADQLVSGLRLAQATAVAQRREVHVVLARQPATLKVCLDAACKLPLSTPAGDSTWLADARRPDAQHRHRLQLPARWQHLAGRRRCS
jgi:prepilin-type N-terminal cleavage/methylation domain-containing protein